MIDLAHIHRSDAEDPGAEPGWRVVPPPGQEGETRDFADSERGGPLAAFLRAVRWRDRAEGRAPSSTGWVAEGLERVERGGLRGWWVSAVLGKVLDADLFEDEAHGGMQGSLAAALAWRARVAPSRPRGGGASSRGGGDSPPRGTGGTSSRGGGGSSSRGKRGSGRRRKRSGGEGRPTPERS